MNGRFTFGKEFSADRIRALELELQRLPLVVNGAGDLIHLNYKVRGTESLFDGKESISLLARVSSDVDLVYTPKNGDRTRWGLLQFSYSSSGSFVIVGFGNRNYSIQLIRDQPGSDVQSDVS
jgi:hypothetical protein